MMDQARKLEIINKFKRHEGDTGSPEVQIALLDAKISDLTGHLRIHKKDHHSRRGLLMAVGQMGKMKSYLKNLDIERYRTLVAALGHRK